MFTMNSFIIISNHGVKYLHEIGLLYWVVQFTFVSLFVLENKVNHSQRSILQDKILFHFENQI